LNISDSEYIRKAVEAYNKQQGTEEKHYGNVEYNKSNKPTSEGKPTMVQTFGKK
jgi:hypothetical protein